VLTALDRFAVSHFRHERALKRSAGATVPVDDKLDVAATALAPDEVFDVAWARSVLEEALRRMREECDAAGRMDVWGVFEARVVAPMLDDAAAPPYDQLVARFGFASPGQASNALVTAKRMFVRAIRGVVGEYEVGDEGIDAEIAELRLLLSRSTR
jgi:hypothetical protein